MASRKLKSIHFAVIQFAYGCLASVVTCIILIVVCCVQNHVPYSYDHYWIYLEVLLCAFLNMMGQNLMTYSNQFSNPATVGLIAYMGVAYNFIVDFTVFDITFVTLQIVGVVICMTCSILASAYKAII